MTNLTKKKLKCLFSKVYLIHRKNVFYEKIKIKVNKWFKMVLGKNIYLWNFFLVKKNCETSFLVKFFFRWKRFLVFPCWQKFVFIEKHFSGEKIKLCKKKNSWWFFFICFDLFFNFFLWTIVFLGKKYFGHYGHYCHNSHYCQLTFFCCHPVFIICMLLDYVFLWVFFLLPFLRNFLMVF